MSWLKRMFSPYPKIVAVIDPIDGGRNKGRYAFRLKRVHSKAFRNGPKAGDTVAVSSIEDAYETPREVLDALREIGFRGEVIVQDG